MSNINKHGHESHPGHERAEHIVQEEPVQHEQLEHLQKTHENSHDTLERDQDREHAHAEVLKMASTVEEARRPHHEAMPAERRRGPITRRQLDHEFKETMTHIQAEMPKSQQAFSRFIHNRGVERTSDFLGATLARPNALLAGAIGAFGLTLGIYLFAKNIGYHLSGFEPIAAFIVGWVIGCLYDYFRVMITGKHQS